MKLRLLQFLRRIRSSYWFWPTVMSLVAMTLALGAERIDRVVDRELLDGFGWIYSGDPAGARAILATIASSMITVAGVVFSITMVALVLASSQFGPRLLSGFMRDRVNQLVLGTFVSTFLYCIVLMRSVQDLEGNVFVPHVAVSFAILLAVLSVGVLIFFIHHVAASIQAPNVIARVCEELTQAVDRAFPPDGEPSTDIGAEDPETRDFDPDDPKEVLSREAGKRLMTVTAGRDGYVQIVDYDALTKLAAEADVIIDSRPMLGDFALPSSPVAEVYARAGGPAPSLDAPEGERPLPDRIRAAFVYGLWRADVDDVSSLARQLVEFAVRALSPGVNDPTTAANCIDRLSLAIGRVAEKPVRARVLRSEDGTLLVTRRVLDFGKLLDQAFHPIREHALGDAAVLARLANALHSIAIVAHRPEDLAALRLHLELVAAAADELPSSWGRSLVSEAAHAPGSDLTP